MKQDNIFLAAIILTVGAAGMMLWPYMDAILWAGFTAYLLHHLADWMDDYIGNRTITTGIMVVVLIGFVAGLFYITLTSVSSLINFLSEFSSILSGSVSIIIDALNLPPALASSIQNVISQLTAESRSAILRSVRQVPGIIVNLLIYFVVAVFLLRDGKQFYQDGIRTARKLPEEYRDIAVTIIESVDDLMRGVFLSYFIVAVAVGALAAIGFYLMGLSFYLGWGIIITIFAFFPIISAPMVYGPLALLYIAIGDFWLGVMILVYGIVVLNTLPEVLLRPYVAAHHTHEHPLLLFTGFIIGPLVLGLKGIILGPILLVVAKNMITMQYFDPG